MFGTTAIRNYGNEDGRIRVMISGSISSRGDIGEGTDCGNMEQAIVVRHGRFDDPPGALAVHDVVG